MVIAPSDREVQEIVRKLTRAELERLASVGIAEVLNDQLARELIEFITYPKAKSK